MALYNFLLQKFLLDKIDTSWEIFFKEQFKSVFFWDLLNFLDKEYDNKSCLPSKENVFRLFRELPVEKIKVVILGQDPYHNPGIADGLAFSTKKEGHIPSSLRNIFLEMKNDIGCHPTSGDLTPWLKQGVFLLNTSLTVIESKPLAHVFWWEYFCNSLIDFLNSNFNSLVWVFWGNEANKNKKKFLFDPKRVISSPHPSPFSARKGFFFSSPFSKINQILISLNAEEINWYF